ncbi:MAG: zinc ABC transporter substrate-binding protein [Donghicola eburneus]|nr:zinc ABC transporter substrate-binding protein [Donghicola eburneus]MCI5040507.1 zinc ABC transporter substrate-binding protein [Donghicola eburneus]
MRNTLTTLALLMAGTANAAPLSVATDIPPVHSLVSMVMGDRGEAVLLMDQGADAHDFQLRPSQARNVANADSVIWMGPELTIWLDDALDSLRGDGASMALLDVEGTVHRGYSDDHEGHLHEEDAEDAHHDDDHGHDEHGDHDDDHDDHADEAHDDHDGHDHSGDDPHAWLDPENANIWVSAIAEHLTALDPEGAEIYAQNAMRASIDLENLIAETRETLEPSHETPIVVFHEAYGHFAGRFDVHIAGSIALGDAAAPGAAHLSELRHHIEDEGAKCIFAEPQHNAALAEQIADELGLSVGMLDPMGSELALGADLYPALIRQMATAIATCQED